MSSRRYSYHRVLFLEVSVHGCAPFCVIGHPGRTRACWRAWRCRMCDTMSCHSSKRICWACCRILSTRIQEEAEASQRTMSPKSCFAPMTTTTPCTVIGNGNALRCRLSGSTEQSWTACVHMCKSSSRKSWRNSSLMLKKQTLCKRLLHPFLSTLSPLAPSSMVD